MKSTFCLVLLLLLSIHGFTQNKSAPYLIVLGVAQDGGYPHIGCQKKCCSLAWSNDSLKRMPVSLALVDPISSEWWLFEATPAITEQLHLFHQLTQNNYRYLPSGIFLTHAHIGHYTGLMQLGREALNAHNIPVFVLPRMAEFLKNNGPWSQLVSLNNIHIHTCMTDSPIALGKSIFVTPFLVPHRDEFSETVGYSINTISKKYLFIPDIDRWERWQTKITNVVATVDYAFIDGTFMDSLELPGRKMEDVPHPYVQETVRLFETFAPKLKSKVKLIHFNHTNPLLFDETKKRTFLKSGFGVATQNESY